MNCEDTQQYILEYVDGGLGDTLRAEMESHFNTCESCQVSLSAFKHTIDLSKSNPIPMPGEEYWNNFPDQILKSYKAQEKTHRPISKYDNFLTSLSRWWNTPTGIRFASGFSSLAIIGILWMLHLYDPGTLFNSAIFQARIGNNSELAFIQNQHLLSTETENNFGFADNTQVNFFRIGTFYSQSLALERGGDYVGAKRQLALMINQLPKSMAQILDRPLKLAQTILVQKNISHATSTLGQLQGSLEKYTRQYGQQQLAFFRLGSWLNDIKLAAITHNTKLFHRQQEQVRYLSQQLHSANVSPRASIALDELEKIVIQPQVDDIDLSSILNRVHEIQTILG